MVANLQFQTSGTVQGVYAQVGDYVNAGEVLADLKADDAWTTYNQAQLNLESANLAMEAPLVAAEPVAQGSTIRRAMDSASELVIGMFRAGAEKL